MKLIKEAIDIEVIKEAAEGATNHYIHGIIMQANKQNKNGRVYSLDVLRNEVARYCRDHIAQNRAYGELGHPDTPTINLDRVSHMWKELHEDGNNFIGKAKILDTPYGKIAKNLIDEGARLGVSSRGLGSISKRGGVDYVGHDFFLATPGDIVADPSAPEAFVRGIMENKEWVFVEGKGWCEQFVEEAKKEIVNTPQKRLGEVELKIFESFLSKLAK